MKLKIEIEIDMNPSAREKYEKVVNKEGRTVWLKIFSCVLEGMQESFKMEASDEITITYGKMAFQEENKPTAVYERKNNKSMYQRVKEFIEKNFDNPY